MSNSFKNFTSRNELMQLHKIGHFVDRFLNQVREICMHKHKEKKKKTHER